MRLPSVCPSVPAQEKHAVVGAAISNRTALAAQRRPGGASSIQGRLKNKLTSSS